MNRPSAITVATVTALLFAGAASLTAYSYLKRQADKGYRGAAVVAATTDIGVGTRLDQQMVKVVAWSKDSLPAGSFAKAGALQGRVAIRPMSAGDVVTEQKLLPLNAPAATGVMSYIVPPGHRAVTVAVNEVTGVAGFLSPLNKVDVVLTTPRPGAVDREDNISKVILQNVPVLAIGQVTEQKDGKPSVVTAVTLDLLPSDAEKVLVGAKSGTLQLLLRNVVDLASVDTKGETVSKVLGMGGSPPAKVRPAARTVGKVETKVEIFKRGPKPAPAAPALYQMEIIKGAAKTTREFAQE